MWEFTRVSFLDAAVACEPIMPLPCVARIESRASRVAPSFDCIDHGTPSELVLELTASFQDMSISRALDEVITDAEDGSLRWLRITEEQMLGNLWTQDMNAPLFASELNNRRAAAKMHHGMAKGDPLSDEVAKKAWGTRGRKNRAGPAAGEREPRGAADVEQASASGFDDALGCDGLMDMLVDAPVSGEPADPEADDAGEPEDMEEDDAEEFFGDFGRDSDEEEFNECFNHDWAPDGIDDDVPGPSDSLANDVEGQDRANTDC